MLELLAQPLTAETFLERHWPGKAFVGDGPVERFSALRSLPELGSATSLARVSAPGLVKAWFGHTSVVIDPDQAPRLLARGAVIYFRGLEARVPALQPFIAALERDLALAPGSVICDAFMGQPGAQVVPHVDQELGFNIQFSGRKRWRLAEDQRLQFPSGGISEGEPVGPELWRDGFEGEAAMPKPELVFEAGPGAVTFVHSSAWHATEVLPGETAFSLVFGISVAPWHTQVAQALSRALQRIPNWRRPAFELDSPDPEVRSRGEAILRELLAELPDIAARMPASEVLQTESTPYLEGGQRFLPIKEQRLRREADGSLEVVVPQGGTLRLSVTLAGPTAALLTQAGGFTGRQALRLARPLSTRRTSTLVRWLVRRGALHRIGAEP